ncbi:hypothetical protein [Alteromonas sp. a30]|uniref:hypothetical protein n=1 Tax=Alteromonas sp. a30 TaxID=2730917 RepID=UPI00227EAC0C|nr:hypothetical protein [Alteromonas sp. a30]MCY7295487.1 hypothetical protein [Alteromonas sp. a30]
MTSDLLFSVLPRLGKEPIEQDKHIVEQVSKEASLRELNDEEKELNSEEREAREKYKESIKAKKKKSEEEEKEEGHQDHNYTDSKGQRHIDDFA